MARDLNAELRDKTQEILELIAIAYGLGDVASLDASWLQQLNHDVEQIIGQHEEAMFGGETSKEWHPLDERLAQTAILPISPGAPGDQRSDTRSAGNEELGR
jgi:hypothetical protein